MCGPLGREIVHIKVGEDLQDFAIHKVLLYHYSPYFKAAFTTGFEESKTGVMKLLEKHVEPFELFYNWLYSQKWWGKNSDQVQWPQMYHVIELYVFVDVARIPILQNQCIDSLRSLSNALAALPTPTFAYVWENKTERSPLRRFLLDDIVWESGHNMFIFGEFAYKGLGNTNISRDNGGNEGSLLEKHKGSRVHQFLFAFEGSDEILRTRDFTIIPNEVIAMSAFSSHIQSSSLRLLQSYFHCQRLLRFNQHHDSLN